MACVRSHNIDVKGLERSGNKILFGYNDGRIDIAVPEIVRGEICRICKTATKYKPRDLYDFLAVKIHTENPPRQINQTKAEDFMWVEAKSGNSKPSESQMRGKSETKIKVMICRAEGVLLNRPENIGIDFHEL